MSDMEENEKIIQRLCRIKHAKWMQGFTKNNKIVDPNCMIDISPGWYTLVEDLTKVLEALKIPGLKAVQIKQKFGGLRYYIEYQDFDRTYTEVERAGVENSIRMAEAHSYHTCEYCGRSPAKLDSIGTGRVVTCCSSCAKNTDKLQSIVLTHVHGFDLEDFRNCVEQIVKENKNKEESMRRPAVDVERPKVQIRSDGDDIS